MVLIYESDIYMCRPDFENGGLREQPLTENGGFQSGPSLKNEGDFGTKNNKETYILFLKGGLSEQPWSEKRTKLRSGPDQKVEAFQHHPFPLKAILTSSHNICFYGEYCPLIILK